MPVDTTRVDYDAALPRWRRVRDAVAGEYAVKAAAETYLPRLGGMNDKDYARYQLGAKWYGATTQTVGMLTGMVMRKPPVIEVPTKLEPIVEDCDLRGTHISVLISTVVGEVIQLGRNAILVDISDAGAPYFATYIAEDVTNWFDDVFSGTTRVVLRESVSVQDKSDEFISGESRRYRVLDVDGNRYRQRLFALSEGSAKYEQEGPDIFPSFRGITRDDIPIFIIGPNDITPDIASPPVEALSGLNLHHYLLAADYAHGCRFTALPQPWVSGFDTDDQRSLLPATIGPSMIWGLPTGAQAGMLEYSGAGLAELREAQEQDKREMADLGARILQTASRSGEAARTVEMKQSAEEAMLASIAKTVEAAITKALQTAADWIGADPDAVKVAINTDFVPTEMDPAMLRELIAAVQAGEISRQEFFLQMQQGEVIVSNKTFDDHAAEIEEDQAARGPEFVPGTAAEPQMPMIENQPRTPGAFSR